MNRRPARYTRHMAHRQTPPHVKWLRLLAVAGVSVVVLLTTCSSPTLPITLAPAPAATAQPADVRALPTVTPAAQAAVIAGGAAPIDLPAAPTAQPATPTDSALSQQLDRYLSDLVASEQFHGAVLVARDGRVVLSKGYGEADSGVLNTATTRMRLASVTKQFTAMGVLILQQRGRLNIDDSICRYLESCPAAWQPVTVRNLLNHTSGIVDYTDFADFEPTEMNPVTPQQLLARFRELPLGFEPGSMYDYCNSNYVLLGLIIEQASGQPYADFMRGAVFEPLGMRNTGYDTNIGQIRDGAVGYTSFSEKSTFLDASTLYSAGGLYSTAEDLWLWVQALSSERLVNKTLLDAMFTPVHMGYGFGWKIDRSGGMLRYSHAGDMTGVANFVARYPEQGLTVIVLSNMDYANPEGISVQLASYALNTP